MALQTEMSSSSSTSTASSSSSTDSSNDNPDTGSFFTPTSSPPLILAFLAIGLLVTAVIAALGWRRAYFARFRSDVGRQMRRGETQKDPMDIGSRPMLWDLWTTLGTRAVGIKAMETPGMSSEPPRGVSRPVSADQEGVNWETVMPISVTALIRECDGKERSEAAQESPLERTSFLFHVFFQSRELLGSCINYLRYHHRQQDHEDATESSPESEKRFVNPRDGLDRCENLQIAVAIAMPMSKDGKLAGKGDESQPDMFEYSMGICRVSWGGKEKQDLSER
ncbi:hypothetical protein GGU10DRAFT_118810 [Lentinula aff. detonsa]|uniref:Uncharacterized protein n=1 Tax=Lentinula aff. detonsa TaxID=2804958 RepID=A0AA38KC58_9AGAR|nr:hypothetical protein GGU10DRAFT_118810 [Lentinula aff. detonsa]